MKERDITKKLASSFSITRVGYISTYIEPISCYYSLDEAWGTFELNPGITSLPVERDGGVVGLITRDNIMKKSKSAWESIKNSPLDTYKIPNTFIIDAHENAEKALDTLLDQEKEDIYNDFLVYNNGKYFGIGTFIKLTKHIAALRNMDLEHAKNMQEYMMSRNEFNHPKFYIEKYVKMVHELGGDFYQTIKINEDLFMVACFDVSGKGVTAALSTSIISSFFTTLNVGKITAGYSPEKIVEFLNDVICEQTPPDVFITGVLIFIDASNKEVHSFNLGYSPLYIFYNEKDGKAMCKIMNPNMRPLGIDKLSNIDKSRRTVPFYDNMKIFIYSDGLTDARDEKGSMYGEENVKQFLFAKSKFKAKMLIEDLTKEITEFIGSAPQSDDITALAIQFN